MQFTALVKVEASYAIAVLVTAVVLLLAWAWRNRIEQQARTAPEASESVPHWKPGVGKSRGRGKPPPAGSYTVFHTDIADVASVAGSSADTWELCSEPAGSEPVELVSAPRRPRKSRQDVPEENTQPPRRQEREEVQVARPGSTHLNLEVCTVTQLKAWLRSKKLKVSGNKAELIARIQAFQAQMEVSPVAPCFHSRTVSGANQHAAWKKCAACGMMTERTMKLLGAPTQYFVGLDGAEPTHMPA